MTLAEATIAYAKSQVGVQEHPKGSNCGPEVERYLAYVNLPKGKAWCAAFVSYRTGTSAAAELSMTSTLRASAWCRAARACPVARRSPSRAIRRSVICRRSGTRIAIVDRTARRMQIDGKAQPSTLPSKW